MNIHGKHVYPALIAPYTTIGLNEVAAVRATNDYQEVGKFNPNVRSLIAYNTDSKVIPTVRSNGVLFAQVIPKGGTVTGTSSIMAMDGWNWEDAVYKADDAIHMNWPSLHVNHGWWGEPQEDKANDQYKKSTDEIRTFFKEARAYNEVETHTTKNLKFEAMRGLFDGSKKLFIRANDAKQIMGAVNFCKEFELQGVIVGGRDSWMITDLLVENEIPVILERVHNLPPKSDDDIDLPFRLSLIHI